MRPSWSSTRLPARRASAIEVTTVRKTYRDRTVLNGVSLSVAPGTIFGLLGPDGAAGLRTVAVG